jgi:hypothetical protein
MKYEHLKHTHVRERPTMLTPPYSVKYFKGRHLLMFTAVVLPVIINGILGGIINHTWWAILSVIIGAGGMLVFHMAVSSGIVSSNTGTYFRDSEPVRFWISTLGVLIVVLLSGISLWFTC